MVRCIGPWTVARMVVASGDPFDVTPGELSGKERFGLPERLGPESVAVRTTTVAINGAYHRAFVLGWPKTLVRPEWMWRLMSLPGPNVITAVFESGMPASTHGSRSGGESEPAAGQQHDRCHAPRRCRASGGRHSRVVVEGRRSGGGAGPRGAGRVCGGGGDRSHRGGLERPLCRAAQRRPRVGEGVGPRAAAARTTWVGGWRCRWVGLGAADAKE